MKLRPFSPSLRFVKVASVADRPMVVGAGKDDEPAAA